MVWAPVFAGTPPKPVWKDDGGVMKPAWSEDPCTCCGAVGGTCLECLDIEDTITVVIAGTASASFTCVDCDPDDPQNIYEFDGTYEVPITVFGPPTWSGTLELGTLGDYGDPGQPYADGGFTTCGTETQVFNQAVNVTVTCNLDGTVTISGSLTQQSWEGPFGGPLVYIGSSSLSLGSVTIDTSADCGATGTHDAAQSWGVCDPPENFFGNPYTVTYSIGSPGGAPVHMGPTTYNAGSDSLDLTGVTNLSFKIRSADETGPSGGEGGYIEGLIADPAIAGDTLVSITVSAANALSITSLSFNVSAASESVYDGGTSGAGLGGTMQNDDFGAVTTNTPGADNSIAGAGSDGSIILEWDQA